MKKQAKKTTAKKAVAKKTAVKRTKEKPYKPPTLVQKWRVKAITPLGEFVGNWSENKDISIDTINNAPRLAAMVLGFATLQRQVIENSIFILETTSEFV